MLHSNQQKFRNFQVVGVTFMESYRLIFTKGNLFFDTISTVKVLTHYVFNFGNAFLVRF